MLDGFDWSERLEDCGLRDVAAEEEGGERIMLLQAASGCVSFSVVRVQLWAASSLYVEALGASVGD
jgi:hypothetical protein